MQPIRNIPQETAAYRENRPLTRRQIGGRMTLLGNGPVVIDAVRGAVIEVEYGTLDVRFDQARDTHELHAGEAFCAVGSDTLTLDCDLPARVRIAWPPESPATRLPAPRRRASAPMPPALLLGHGRTPSRIAAR